MSEKSIELPFSNRKRKISGESSYNKTKLFFLNQEQIVDHKIGHDKVIRRFFCKFLNKVYNKSLKVFFF